MVFLLQWATFPPHYIPPTPENNRAMTKAAGNLKIV